MQKTFFKSPNSLYNNTVCICVFLDNKYVTSYNILTNVRTCGIQLINRRRESDNMSKSDTKEKLIEAAMNLFSTKGYDGTSVDEIAESIGIKGPTIYKYFKGKEALLEALISQADEEYNKGFQIGLEMAKKVHTGADFKEYVLVSFTRTLDNEHIKKMRKLFTIEQYRNETFSEIATKHQIQNIRNVYADIFKRLMAAGVMVKGNPDIIALEFTAPNTVMLQMCDRDSGKRDEVLKTVEEHTDTFIERYFI